MGPVHNGNEKKSPVLKKNLVFRRQDMGTEVYYIVKDPDSHRYFRFGLIEYSIMKMMEKEDSLQSITIKAARMFPDRPPDCETVERFSDSLVENDLAVRDAKTSVSSLIKRLDEERKHGIHAGKGSFFYRRFPIVNPDRYFRRMVAHIEFFWTKEFFRISGFIIIASWLWAFMNRETIDSLLRLMMEDENSRHIGMISVWFVSILMILIHELSHGLTCRHFGGEVREMGVLLLIFQPCLYCNVSDSWTFKKNERIIVTLAGVYMELFMGALAVGVMMVSSPGTFVNIFSLQVFLASLISAFGINLNPLVRLDGYYLLSDWLDVPNLRQVSRRLLAAKISGILSWADVDSPEEAHGREGIVLVYAVASLVYTVGILLALSVLAGRLFSELLPGFGPYPVYALFLFFAAQWMYRLILQQCDAVTLKKLIFPRRILPAAILLSVFISLMFVKIEVNQYTPCSVQTLFTQGIIADTGGFVISSRLVPGMDVRRGEKVAVLGNSSLEAELAALNAEIRGYSGRDNTSTFLSDLMRRREKIISKIAELEVVSPVSGVVLSVSPGLYPGAGFSDGESLAVVGDITVLAGDCAVKRRHNFPARIGNVVEARFSADPFVRYPGMIVKVADMNNDMEGAISGDRVMFSVENTALTLKPGMKGTVCVKTGMEYTGWLVLRWIISVF